MSEYKLLQLASPDGPVFRKVRVAPLRDARSDEVPVIDVSGMYSQEPEARAKVARAIAQAATNSGFFYICNHDIPENIITAAYESATAFFKQPENVKSLAHERKSQCGNGWQPPLSKQLNETESVDVRETFSTKYDPEYDPDVKDLKAIPEDVKRYLRAESFQWEATANMPDFKRNVIAYWQASLRLARDLLHMICLGLGLPEDYLDSKATYPDATLAINYYAPITPPKDMEQEEEVSIGSHTDFQLFTILWQDKVGGLQILNKQGEWISARPIENAFVVNIADFLQRITNDSWVSTVHRAKNTSGLERMSMPLFFGFNLNETCGVLPSCVSESTPAKYPPIMCDDWVQQRFKSSSK